MKTITNFCIVTVCAGVVVFRCSVPGRAADVWQAAQPESQGFSSGRLDALRTDLAQRNTKSLLVIRNDAIVCEWYAAGATADTKLGTASLAKAIVGGVSLAVALSDGRLNLDEPAAKFIPAWRGDPRKFRITLRQLGSHTSGIEDAEDGDKPHDKLTGWKGDFWKQLPVPDDPFTTARDRASLVFEPGAKMSYSNPGIALMTWCVTAALHNAPRKTSAPCSASASCGPSACVTPTGPSATARHLPWTDCRWWHPGAAVRSQRGRPHGSDG